MLLQLQAILTLSQQEIIWMVINYVTNLSGFQAANYSMKVMRNKAIYRVTNNVYEFDIRQNLEDSLRGLAQGRVTG